MLFERQHFEAHEDNIIPSPPEYHDTKVPFASQTYGWSTDGKDYFLVEVFNNSIILDLVTIDKHYVSFSIFP